MSEIAVVLIVAYAGLVMALFAFQRHLMYQPGDHLPAPEQTEIPDAQARITEPEPGLRLVSWYLPPAENKPVVLYYHGNAGTIAERDFKAAGFRQDGKGIWLTGYRGFAGNPGSPTEQGLYADARAALAALVADGIEPGRIILYGESLGTGMAVQMALELAEKGTPAKAVILEAPFASMGTAAQDRYFYVPAKWLVKDRYDNLAKIDRIDAPLLIMHGDADGVVRQSHGKRLFEAAKEPKTGFWPAGGGHSNLEQFGLFEAVNAFLRGG